MIIPLRKPPSGIPRKTQLKAQSENVDVEAERIDRA
jgi:hypothetical protein